MIGPAFGLLGSGEFDPWAEDVDRWLLGRSTTPDGPVLILPTASAPEGDDVFDSWGAKGLAHYERQGIPAEVVPIKTREDADRPEHARRLAEASMVFFSGGNPAYLPATLAGTAFWQELRRRLRDGMPYGGCSAGVACLSEWAPDSASREFTPELWKPGLGLFRRVWFGPHWNMLDVWVPGLREFIERSVADGELLFAIDEDTAAVGDGSSWSVIGSGAVHLRRGGEWRDVPAGESFEAPLDIQEG